MPLRKSTVDDPANPFRHHPGLPRWSAVWPLQATPSQPLPHGGLFAILARNSPQPVWLRRGPRGSVTHTYIEGYSATGGDAPPLSALHGEKIFTPKRDAVIRFLKSFGLSDDDAAEVVRRVGTAP